MNPDDHTTGTGWSRFLRRLYAAQQHQAERDRHRGDHETRGGAEQRKNKRRIAAASRRKNR